MSAKMTKQERKKNEKATGAWFIKIATDKDLKRKPRLKIVRGK